MSFTLYQALEIIMDRNDPVLTAQYLAPRTFEAKSDCPVIDVTEMPA